METKTVRQTHPFIVVAAISVSLFSLTGIGAMLGWIPTSVGGSLNTSPIAPAPEIAQPVKPVAAKSVIRQAKPRPVAVTEPPQPVAQAVIPPPPPIVAAICRECAVIEDVREVEKAGQPSGVGAVGGAVVGGVIGHQVGGGRGKDIATVLGAIGGGIAGNKIEKNVQKTKEYQIVVRYEDGTKGMFVQATPPGWRIGDKVKVINDVIQLRG